MLKIQNKMESSDMKLPDEVHKLNESFEQLKSDLARTKQNRQYNDLDNTKIFINQSLCPYYKLLWSKSKRLHAMKQIHSYYISNGTVKVKIEENDQPTSITHAFPISMTSISISLTWILIFQVRCISPVALILLCLIFMILGCLSVEFGVSVYKSWVSLKFYF